MKFTTRVCPGHFVRRGAALAGVALLALTGGCVGGGMESPGGYVPPEKNYPYSLPPVYAPAPAVIPPAVINPPPVPVVATGPVVGPVVATNGAKVLLGIDVLAAQHFSILQGKRVGLLTHAAGVNAAGVSTIDVLRHAPGVNLVALYAPEHGLDGKVLAGEEIPKIQKDKKTGLPVYALFQTPEGDFRKASPDMLAGIDVMVVDLQDLGTRSYTFISCLLCTMEACFEQGKTVVVLDRPNPLGGLKVGGPIIEDKWISYVGAYRMPYVFGLTIGELARVAKENPDLLMPSTAQMSPAIRKLFETSRDGWKRGNLIVVPMSGWRRSMLWPDTGLKWYPTSPNIPTWQAAFGYSLTGLESGGEMGNFQLGVGTPYPFQLLNYKEAGQNRNDKELAAQLNALKLGGLNFVNFVYGTGIDQKNGVLVKITDWNAVEPTRLAYELMKLDATWTSSGNPFARATEAQARSFNIISGSTAWWSEITTKGKRADVAAFFKTWDAQDLAFQQRTRPWWIYPE
ncbi:MAG TPA: DUF1343 domain-containing protein [Opitutales bacterium]|nr:DUF1343 domain-containing protein [Opitutales bacterium]